MEDGDIADEKDVAGRSSAGTSSHFFSANSVVQQAKIFEQPRWQSLRCLACVMQRPVRIRIVLALPSTLATAVIRNRGGANYWCYANVTRRGHDPCAWQWPSATRILLFT